MQFIRPVVQFFFRKAAIDNCLGAAFGLGFGAAASTALEVGLFAGGGGKEKQFQQVQMNFNHGRRALNSTRKKFHYTPPCAHNDELLPFTNKVLDCL